MKWHELAARRVRYHHAARFGQLGYVSPGHFERATVSAGYCLRRSAIHTVSEVCKALNRRLFVRRYRFNCVKVEIGEPVEFGYAIGFAAAR
jgi:hypothetical protein